MAPQTFGRYQVTQRLSRSSMAEVYEARDPALGRRVAIKVIHPYLAAAPGFTERFRREAELVARLRHPHIIQLYDFGESDEQTYLVMEYLEGGTLADALAQYRSQGKTLPLPEVERILRTLAGALDYAHGQEAVHGDIRPVNILFTARRDPVLADFGLARIIAESAQGASGSTFTGSPVYMSPEQAAGKPIDARSDLYMLGIIAYEMVTGRPPFQGGPPIAIMMQQINEAPPPPRQFVPELPAETETVLLKALSKDPRERFPDARSLADALAAAIHGAAPAKEVPGPPSVAAADRPAADVSAPAEPLPPTPGPANAPETVAAQAPVPETATPSTEMPQAAAATPAGTAAAEPPAAPAAEEHLLPAWLGHLAGVAEVGGALIGRQVPHAHEPPQDRRGLLATVFATIGILLAAFQFIVQVFDLVGRQMQPLVVALPYIIIALLCGGAALSVYIMVRSRSRVYKARARLLFSVILVIGLVWGGWSAYNHFRPVTGFLIAVGEFDGPKATRQIDFGRRIYDQIKTEVSDGGSGVTVQRTLEAYANQETARARGLAARASLVIWGWYDDAGVSPHVEMLRMPSMRNEPFSVPMLVTNASAAVTGSELSGAPAQQLRSVARYVHNPVAIPDFDLFVKNGPQQMTYVAESILGMVYFANGDNDRALAMFDKALANAPAGGGDIVGQEVIYFQRSTVLYQQKKLDEATADLEKAVSLKPDMYEAHHNLALVYAETCKPALQLDRAIDEAKTAVRLQPESAEAHRLLGDLYRQARRYDEAVPELETAERIAPADAEIQASLADVYEATGNQERATAARQRSVALRQQAPGQPSDPVRAHLDLGDAYMGTAEYDKALAEYQAAQKLAPSNPAVYRGMGNAYYWAKQYDQAEQQYRHLLSLTPKDADGHLLLGLLLSQQKKPQEAIAELKQAAELSSCSSAEHISLANAYWDQGDLVNAMAEFQTALAIEPDNADVHYMLGVLRLLQATDSQAPNPSLLPQAVESLTTAVKLRPSFAEAYFALGSVYMDQKAYADAAHAFELAVENRPDDPDTYASLANAYEKLKRWDDAAAAYKKALAIKDDANNRLYLGLVYSQQGKYDQALAEFQRALELDPQNKSVYLNLGSTYVRLGKLDEAAATFERGLVLADDAGLHAVYADVLQQQGKIEQAIAEDRRAVALDPQNWAAGLQLGGLLMRERKLDDAAAAFEAVLAAKPDNAEAHYNLASIAYKRCNLTQAAQEAATAVKLAQGAVAYQALLAGTHEAQGRTEEADQVYASMRAAPASDSLSHLIAGDSLLRRRKPDSEAADLTDATREFQTVLETANLVPALAALAHVELGEVYYIQGKLVAAQSEYQSALALSPASANAQLRLGDVAMRQGDAAAGLAAYDKAVALLPAYEAIYADSAATTAPTLQFRRGLALRRLGRETEAAAAMDQALSLASGLSAQLPQWALAHSELGAVYLARGEDARADPEFAAATQCDATQATARSRIEDDLAGLR